MLSPRNLNNFQIYVYADMHMGIWASWDNTIDGEMKIMNGPVVMFKFINPPTPTSGTASR